MNRDDSFDLKATPWRRARRPAKTRSTLRKRRARTQVSDEEGQLDPLAEIKKIRREAEELFDSYEKATRRSERNRIVEKIAAALCSEAALEADVLIPALREKIDDSDLDVVDVERDCAMALIAEMSEASDDHDLLIDAKAKALAKFFSARMQQIETWLQSLAGKGAESGWDGKAITEKLRSRKAELLSEGDGRLWSQALTRKVIRGRQEKEMDMAQAYRGEGRGRYDFGERDERSGGHREERDYSGRRMPERDEEGRFMSEDESGRSGGSRYRGHETPPRDEYGRFMSEDESRSSHGGEYRGRGSYEGEGRYGRDEDYRGRGRHMPERDEQGRFMSEDEQRGSRSRYSRDENYSRSDRDREGRSYASRYEEDRRGRHMPERDEQGRFMSEDEQRGSQSRSSREDDYPRRGRNYEESESRRDPRYSRSDEDERSSGHGGWFGDPEGHSEASRRGWSHRR